MTILAVLILLAGGVIAYRSLKVELFPEIEFPLVTVNTVYASAGPEAVVRDVTAPVERAIAGIPGLETVLSTSFEGNSLVLANFKYGTDMDEAESAIDSALGGIVFPGGVDEPTVGRFNPAQFPVIQFSVVSDEDSIDLQQVVDERILPAISGIDGIMLVQVAGETERQVEVIVDPNRLAASGVSLFGISSALSENNLTLPAGLVFEGSQAIIAKTTHTLDSVEAIEGLIVGATESGPVRLGDVADVRLGAGAPTSISRTNGKPGVGVSVLKTPEANTIDVTSAVQDALDSLRGLPRSVDIIVVSDQGPQIQHQIDTLLREAMFGFLFAVSVVFAFMLTIRPTVRKGLLNTLRPTVVIALSIPLSVLTGVVLMAWQDMTLNFMTLGGLAISVGRAWWTTRSSFWRTLYRHIQGGRERWRAAMEATMEVGPRDLRVHANDGGGVPAARVHTGPRRRVLPAVRAHGLVRAAGVAARGPDRRAGAGGVPAAPRRPAGGRGRGGRGVHARDVDAARLHARAQVGAEAPDRDAADGGRDYGGEPGPHRHNPDNAVPERERTLPVDRGLAAGRHASGADRGHGDRDRGAAARRVRPLQRDDRAQATSPSAARRPASTRPASSRS